MIATFVTYTTEAAAPLNTLIVFSSSGSSARTAGGMASDPTTNMRTAHRSRIGMAGFYTILSRDDFRIPLYARALRPGQAPHALPGLRL